MGVGEDRKYWLWLTTIDGIGRKKVMVLLDFCSDPKVLFYKEEKDFSKVFGQPIFNKRDVKAFFESRNLDAITQYEKRLVALGIGYVTLEEESYPINLRKIYDPPLVLYYRGRLYDGPLSIAVVGSRKCTAYGRKVAEKFGKDLGEKGVNVVSGLARGIDTFSHKGALDGEGFTTAVLGCGINICYPKENVAIMKEIIQKGCIISEYGLDVSPRAGLFPMRNRIISGLSSGVLLVEAKEKSGSLITVDMALEQGKDVYAVPGDVLGQSNNGSNNIIRMGGKPVFSVSDILEEYGGAMGVKTMIQMEVDHYKSGVGSGEENNQENNTVTNIMLNQMDKDEEAVYSCLGHAPLFIDEIREMIGFDIRTLQFVLTKLEIKGMVVQLPGKHYIRNY